MCSGEQAVVSSTAASGTATAAPTISFSSSTAVQYDDDDDVITDVLQDEVSFPVHRALVIIVHLL
jgi:hypothetical protein